jgi:hypothetical protein
MALQAPGFDVFETGTRQEPFVASNLIATALSMIRAIHLLCRRPVDSDSINHHICSFSGIGNWRDPCIGAFSAHVLERGPGDL